MPRTRSTPPLGGDMHAIMRIVEVLPAPFGPRKPNTSPRTMSKSTPSTATNSPNSLRSPRALTTTGGPPDTGRPYRRPGATWP